MKANEIGLEEKEVRPIVDQLNELLANYHIHYQNLRGSHWNVKGGHFFSLHAKFEELYNTALLSIDELAERILTLGKSPYSTFSDYINHSTIKEVSTIGLSDNALVESIMNDLTTLIEIERQLMQTTAAAGDDGTNDMINKFIQYQEKNNWMFRAFLGRN